MRRLENGNQVQALGGVLALAFVLFGCVTMASAAPPPYTGDMSFPAINGAADPEEYSWEVQLGPEQALEQLDDQHAQVYYEHEHQPAFTITAEPAHDAFGISVPTTLTVSEETIITLTVHHRDGNPAAGGEPFAYPVSAGPGWEPGSAPVVITGPPDEQEIKEREARERITGGLGPGNVPERKRHPRLAIRACGKLAGVPLHAHGLTCRTARRVYRADMRDELPSGWTCSASLARCYRGSLGSPRYLWWKRTVY